MTLRHRWSFPSDMLRSYEYLYNTMDTPLRVQMSADIWRLVYDFRPVYDRASNWATGIGLGYTRVHALDEELMADADYRDRLADLQENAEGLDERILQEMIAKQQQAIEALQAKLTTRRNMWFAPPTRAVDRNTGMSFEMQTDSFYCALHALNNVARAVVLAPPAILAAIECTRTLEQRYAAPEDVMLAAMREGIFMVQLKLTDVDDLAPMDTREQPTTRHFLALLNDAGGMLVYQPNGYNVGHYVALVNAGSTWLIVSMGAVVARASTAAGVLDLYIAHATGLEATSSESAHALRTQATARRTQGETSFIGLMPISLAGLWNGERATSNSIMARTLLRRTLSEWRLCELDGTNDGMRDMWTPAPLSPCAIEEIGWFIDYKENPAPSCRSSGLETINLASFIGGRHGVYRELNRLADDMMRALRREKDNDYLVLLKQTRSYLRSAPAIDFLFLGTLETSRRCDDLELSGTYNGVLMSNRRWFRFIVLSLVCTALIDDIERTDGSIDHSTFPIALLFALLCYHNLSGYGATKPHYINNTLVDLQDLDVRSRWLPYDSLPDTISDIVRNELASFLKLHTFPSYDMSLWLLIAAKRHLQSFALRADVVQAFAPSRATYDDNRFAADNAAFLVTLLRDTLFQLPLAGEDVGRIQALLHEQDCFETSGLAEHNRTNLRRFFGHVPQLRGAFELSDPALMHIIDVFAFDVRYIEQAPPLSSAAAEQSEDEDNWSRPRFLALAAREGFVHMHRRTFGVCTLRDDRRAVAINNIDRVTLPSVSGQWRTARVRTERAQQLSVVPLSRLQVYDEAQEAAGLPPTTEWTVIDYKRRRTATVTPL